MNECLFSLSKHDLCKRLVNFHAAPYQAPEMRCRGDEYADKGECTMAARGIVLILTSCLLARQNFFLPGMDVLTDPAAGGCTHVPVMVGSSPNPGAGYVLP